MLVGFAAFSVAGCHQKGSLEGGRVEMVKVEGRRFEVRVAPTETANEYRMLVIRATMVINPRILNSRWPEPRRSLIAI
jgi:hypothetical protein